MDLQIIIALIGCIPGLLAPILADVSRRKRESIKLDVLYKRIDIIEKTLMIYSQHSNSQRNDSMEDSRLALLDQLSNLSKDLTSTSSLVSVDKRRLTLVERWFPINTPKSTAGWWLHILFYMVVGMLVFLWGVALISTFYVWEVPWMTYIMVTIGALAFFFIVQHFANQSHRSRGQRVRKLLKHSLYRYCVFSCAFVLAYLPFSNNILGQSNLSRIRADIGEINRSINNIDVIIDSATNGREFLSNNYPDTKEDLIAMLIEMDKTVNGLAAGCSIITHFAFVVGDNQNLQRYLRQYEISRDLSSQLNRQLDILRGSCRAIREHADRIASDAHVPSLFHALGIRPAQDLEKLILALNEIYDEESHNYLAISRMGHVVELTLRDIKDSLGNPMDPQNIPDASILLQKYSDIYEALQSNCNYISMKIKSLIIDLEF